MSNLTSPSAAPYPDEQLREGAVVDCRALRADLRDEYDYVVIGSGAAGAVAAHTLAKSGASVAILEEGPWVKTRDFSDDLHTSFNKLMRMSGTQILTGRSFMPLLQGRCVGGSTVINSAIAWRTPEDVVESWQREFGLGESVTMAKLDPHFDALERDLNVHPVNDEVLGTSNRLFVETAKAIGIAGAPMQRYERGCKGSSRCLTGCPSAAKQGMNVSYIPWALSHGARIFSSCRASKIEVRNGRAVAVHGRAVDTEGGPSRKVTLIAKKGVFLAASAIQTPNVLRRSGLRNSALGRHFQAHPGLATFAMFDKPIDMYFGATQGAEAIDFRKSDRFKLETISMPPEIAAIRVPGVGREFVERLTQLGNTAMWVVQVRAKAEGVVRPGFGGADQVSFSLLKSDLEQTRKACAVLARLYFAAGAREVWPGIYGVPPILTSPDQVRLIEEGPLDSRAYSFIATHLFGTARMGPDRESSVVGLDFSAHDAKGLYVVDSSIFPTNLGVNPQHSIMAISRLVASQVAEA